MREALGVDVNVLVPGHLRIDAGEKVEWGGLLGTAIVQDPGKFSCNVLFARGGRIPAPLQSYKN